MSQRVRFEVRILGVAKVQTFHYSDVIPDPLPAVGDYAYTPSLSGPHSPRRVVEIESHRLGMAVVHLEPIDCSRSGELSLARSVATLRAAGWLT